jgi:hypothetical protein
VPSRLELLQEVEEARESDHAQAAAASVDSTPLFKCESVMSISELTEEDLQDGELKTDMSASTGDDPIIHDSGSVTIDDIREHVWLWCHEHDDREKKTVREFNAEFTRKHTVKLIPSRGERRKKQIIDAYSTTEEDLAKMRPPTNTEEAAVVREAVQKSYSGYCYQKYLYSGKMPVPDYLDSVVFSEVIQQRKEEFKAWKNARKANPADHSPRIRIG